MQEKKKPRVLDLSGRKWLETSPVLPGRRLGGSKLRGIPKERPKRALSCRKGEEGVKKLNLYGERRLISLVLITGHTYQEWQKRKIKQVQEGGPPGGKRGLRFGALGK